MISIILMARPREFDRKEALGKAMLVFWQKGFDGASCQDLLDAMQINRGSMYDTFGDKASLYLEALRHYRNTVIAEVGKPLFLPNAGRPEIEEFCRNLVNSCALNGEMGGCFLGNAINERGQTCARTREFLQETIASMEQVLRSAVLRGIKNGEISAQTSAKAIAQALCSTMIGVKTLSKISEDPNLPRNIIEVMLRSI